MTKKILSELTALLESQRSFIKNVEKLSSEQLNWVPKGSKNSVGILLDHLIGSESMLIHQMVFGIEINRNRDKEFESRDRSLKDLIIRYEETVQKTKNLLELKLEDENLFEERMRRDTKHTVFWAITHAIEHNYYHIGQINLLVALLDSHKGY